MFALARRLRGAGIMGINARNANYVLRYNSRKRYPLVDDKSLTKNLAHEAGIAVPDLYHTVEIEQQIKDLPSVLAQHREFVIKPAQGSGGNGIVVINEQRQNGYRKTSGLVISQTELQHHVSNILSGLYSLGGQPDKALIEYLVKADPVFDEFSYLGVPDIRVIVFFGVPIMAMARLPTRSSDGKANLHQGAIGAGIDIKTGKAMHAVWRNENVFEHPDTGADIRALSIPGWDEILTIATRCYGLTGLGYQGVDIVIDRSRGPLMLELNARPGLNIQIANRCGLLKRLKLVEANRDRLTSPADCLTFSREHFGA